MTSTFIKLIIIGQMGQTVVRYIKKIMLPYVEKVKLEKQLYSLILCHVFRRHETEEVDILLKENKLLKVHIPSTCTDKLKP